MAHNKLAWHARHSSQQRRDVRRLASSTDVGVGIASRAPGPVRNALGRDLLEQVWQHMDVELRQIAALRLNGKSWTQIAATLGGTGESRRKQFQRGMDRITRLLGIGNDD